MNANQGQQAQLDLQRVLILYQHGKYSFVSVSVSALVIAYVLQIHLNLAITLTWFTAALSVIPIRLMLISGFFRTLKSNEMTGGKALIWERRWVMATAIPALVFASSVYLPYTEDHLITHLFIGMILVSMISGSIVSSTTSMNTVMVFIHLSIIPFIAECFMETDRYHILLGCFFIVFYFVFCSLSLRIHRTMLRSIQVQIERQDMSYKDSLTALWNRRKLYFETEQMVGSTYCVMLIDVDHFKQFNDKHGHSKGDEILVQISSSIVRCVGAKDLVVRYGGEEFLVVFPGILMPAAEAIADNIRAKVVAECGSTVSIGIADTNLDQDFDALVDLADKAMYLAKNGGRNCVKLASAQGELNLDGLPNN